MGQTSEANNSPVAWVIADDLLAFWDSGDRHPTGVLRVCLEVFDRLTELKSDRIKYCRTESSSGQFVSITLPELLEKRRHAIRRRLAWYRIAENAWIKLKSHWQGIAATKGRASMSIKARAAAPELSVGAEVFKPGDILAAFHGGWGDRRYVPAVAAAKEKYKIRYALLVHDIIPITHPKYCIPGHDKIFAEWFDQIFKLADLIFTSSHYGREMLIAYGKERALPVPPIALVPFGAGFKTAPKERSRDVARRLEPYVLLVSTIEVRKNHILMFKVWSRLIAKYGAEKIPKLVFAGHMGWRVEDLQAALRSSKYLGGKIVHAKKLTDAALAEYYSSCLFTVFPSLVEGWGLPVAESLTHGKFCVSSNRASLPEVGGEFCDFFEPGDEDDCFAKIERVIFDREYLQARTGRIKESYMPNSWEKFVDTAVAKLV